jgi:hypothetical protein
VALGLREAQERVEMRVEIDEAGGDDQAGRVDHAPRTSGGDELAGDDGDAVARNCHVSTVARSACAIGDDAAGNQQVIPRSIAGRADASLSRAGSGKNDEESEANHEGCESV